MKAKVLFLALCTSVTTLFAQDRTTVTATTNDISDNLDLRAVASIFGDSENLEDFERRLNDPKTQISNLDLNRDNQVDYLRVIESVEGNTHLIIVQSVLDRDIFQDVATIEVERGSNNQVQVQVVGDVYMYGNNYIYEPVYVHTPIIYSNFWGFGYRPYYSSWYWGYYPPYYYAWNPCPIFRYRNHIHSHINTHHHYNYVNVRRSHRAVAMYNTRRSNGYERRHPDRSFTNRNVGVSNRHELAQTRGTRDSGNIASFADGGIRTNSAGTVRNSTGTRATTQGTVRSNSTRNTTSDVNSSSTTPRNTTNSSGTRNVTSNSTRSVSITNTRGNSDSASNDPREISTPSPRGNSSSSTGIRSVSASNPRTETSPRQAETTGERSVSSTPRSSRVETQSTPRVSSEPARTTRTSESPRSSSRSESPRVSSQPQRSSESNSSVRSSSSSQSSARSAAPQGNSGQRSSGGGTR